MSEIIYASAKNVMISELQPGMLVDRDVYSQHGTVLLPKGQILTDIQRITQLLEQHDIFMVAMRLPREIPSVESFQERQATAFMTSVDEKCDRLRNEFQHIMLTGELQEEMLEERIAETLSAFEADINVIQLMQRVRDSDDATYVHAHNVALTSHLIGRWMQLSEKQVKELTITALFIDIGKMKVSASVLKKQGTLTAAELEEAHRHAQYSYEMIKNFSFINHEVIMGVLHHHERMDGSGYPMKLKGERIPFFARIVAVADVYNALTSMRPYRPKRTPFEAIRIMETECTEQFDPQVLYLFLNKIGNLFTGQRILLNDGRTGEIIFVPKQNIHRPMVRLESEDVLDLNAPEGKSIVITEFV